LPVDVERWIRLARATLVDAGAAPKAELSVLFVDAEAIAELNERHMGHTGATDVLSFPLDGAEPALPDVPALLGDVVICPSVAARNAADHAGTYEDEIALLLVHGILHLLGMDHAGDDERVAMQQRERDLLARHHGSLARDPWS
jgi:probable rRNA maturation factor